MQINYKCGNIYKQMIIVYFLTANFLSNKNINANWLNAFLIVLSKISIKLWHAMKTAKYNNTIDSIAMDKWMPPKWLNRIKKLKQNIDLRQSAVLQLVVPVPLVGLDDDSGDPAGELPVALEFIGETPAHIVQQAQLSVLPLQKHLVGPLTLQRSGEAHSAPCPSVRTSAAQGRSSDKSPLTSHKKNQPLTHTDSVSQI